MLSKSIYKYLKVSYANFEINNEVFELVKNKIADSDYFDFIIKYNGGLFFNNSLLLYSFSLETDIPCISVINDLIEKEFSNIVQGLYCFGQDIFGNQFAFCNNKIVWFNIETGDMDILADDFKDWEQTLCNDIDYYTGRNLASQIDSQTLIETRLCPKIPFVIGGEFTIANLYTAKYPNYIKINANIARQIYHLPEGANIKLSIEE